MSRATRQETEILFKRDRLYSRPEIKERVGISDRGLDVWLARAEIPRFAFSKKCIRYLGADLEDAVVRVRQHPATRARPTGAVAVALARLDAGSRRVARPEA
jgi:hypothetical protein